VSTKALASAKFANDNALTSIISKCGVFYAKQDGTARQTQVFDNGTDYFSDGLARLIVNGKYGYMNEALATIVGPAYDFAWPFQCGVARVCNGCTTTADGDHTSIYCNACGLIDARGGIVALLGSTDEELAEQTPACNPRR
jgi:hypothetical protein